MFPGLTIFSNAGSADPEFRSPEGSPEAERAGFAFSIDEPVSVVSPVVFASPHSGRLYPKGFLDTCSAAMIDLRRIEDAYVDRLLAGVHLTGSPVICGLIGRAVIDLNRAESEMDPSMFVDPLNAWSANRSPRIEAGLGCLPRIAFNGTQIYNHKLRRAEAEARLEQIHRPYHRALDALLRRAQAMFGQAWLVDIHSMPAETSGTARSPDIVIGDRFGAACRAGFADRVEQLFRERGYSTARNTPYAGGYATMTHGQPVLGRHALQIEIRRKLYLDEATVEPTEGFLPLRRHLEEIASEICDYTRQIAGDPKKKWAAPEAGAAKVLGSKRP
jgi:N-formylglutamate amidohydrolase